MQKYLKLLRMAALIFTKHIFFIYFLVHVVSMVTNKGVNLHNLNSDERGLIFCNLAFDTNSVGIIRQV